MGEVSMLVSGAHGVMLDIAHGHYPYVTSSGCLPSDVGSGLGVDPRRVRSVIGVMKPYVTLVGRGPMLDEIKPMDRPPHMSDEIGTVTGRSRRLGWLDVPAIKYADSVCGFNHMALTRLDSLDGMSSIPVLDNGHGRLDRIYLPGWDKTSGISKWDDLPREAQKFVNILESMMGIEIKIISTGAHRDATIDRRERLREV